MPWSPEPILVEGTGTAVVPAVPVNAAGHLYAGIVRDIGMRREPDFFRSIIPTNVPPSAGFLSETFVIAPRL